MVPLTIVAFILADLTLDLSNKDIFKLSTYDGIGLAVVTVGVFIMNFFKEKPQRVCIVDDDQLDVDVVSSYAHSEIDMK